MCLRNEYKLFYNLKGNVLKMYKKAFEEEKYEILSENKKGVILIGKGDAKLSEEQINLIIDNAYGQYSIDEGILIVDITEAVEYLLQKTTDGKEAYNVGVFRWKLRNIIIREQANKQDSILKIN